MSYAKAGAADSEMVWMGSVSLATGRTKSARSGARRKEAEGIRDDSHWSER